MRRREDSAAAGLGAGRPGDERIVEIAKANPTDGTRVTGDGGHGLGATGDQPAGPVRRGVADACAALVEDGWPTASRSLLARQLDPADVDRAGRALLGGIPPEPDELTRRRLTHAMPELAAPSGGLPRWATVGVQLGDEVMDDAAFLVDRGLRVRVLHTARRLSQDQLAETAQVSRGDVRLHRTR